MLEESPERDLLLSAPDGQGTLPRDEETDACPPDCPLSTSFCKTLWLEAWTREVASL